MKVSALPDKVKFIVKNRDDYNSLEGKTAYVAFDKNGEKTGLKWAEYIRYMGSERVEIAPDIVECDNSDFELTILKSPSYSSQGGKLSFMMCKIEKGDISYNVGINTDILVELLTHSTFKNGKCQEPVVFVRADGQLGMLTKEMAIDAYAWKKQILDKKKAEGTTKWEPGVFYGSLERLDAYVCDLVYAFDVKKVSDEHTGITEYKVSDKHHKKKLVVSADDYSRKKKEKGNIANLSEYLWKYAAVKAYSSLPKRAKTGQTLKFDMSAKEYTEQKQKEQVSDLLDTYEKYVIGQVGFASGRLDVPHEHNINNLNVIYRHGDTKPEDFKFTDDEIKLIRYIYDTDMEVRVKAAEYSSRGFSLKADILTEESRAFLKSILDKR